jgi:hypothetical protein
MYTDTLKASIPSISKDLYAQVFVTDFKWARAFPMKNKSDAVQALDLLLHREGAPEKMIMDGSKEQTLGKFCKTCQDASIHVKQTEPHSPWQNAAEGVIRELKKASGRKMVRAGSSKPFWADAIEWEAKPTYNPTLHGISSSSRTRLQRLCCPADVYSICME